MKKLFVRVCFVESDCEVVCKIGKKILHFPDGKEPKNIENWLQKRFDNKLEYRILYSNGERVKIKLYKKRITI